MSDARMDELAQFLVKSLVSGIDQKVQEMLEEREATIVTLKAELNALKAELAEARKPMRVIVQPDFKIDLEDE